MNRDKAQLNLPDGLLIEQVFSQLEPHFNEIIVSASETNCSFFKKYRTVVDEKPGQGPLQGILSGLKTVSGSSGAFCIAIDIPEIDIRLLERIYSSIDRYEIVVTQNPAGLFEPLYAYYSCSVIPKIDFLLNAGIKKVLDLYPISRTKIIKSDRDKALLNLNTPEDLAKYLALKKKVR